MGVLWLRDKAQKSATLLGLEKKKCVLEPSILRILLCFKFDPCESLFVSKICDIFFSVVPLPRTALGKQIM